MPERFCLTPPGGQNTADGAFALFNNSGVVNTAIGDRTLFSNTTGNFNTAVGVMALSGNTTGSGNTAVGVDALSNNTTADANTAIGASALVNNTVGTDNTATGGGALGANTTGVSNTAIGAAAGENQTTGSNNIYIGQGSAGVAGESNTCYIQEIFGRYSPSGVTVFVNSAGKLGTSASSRRFKNDIKPMNKASEKLYALQPVTFHYKKEIDPTGISQLGLVAEDVGRSIPI